MEIPIIPQNLSINKLRTTSAKSIRKPAQHEKPYQILFKNVLVKPVFTLTFFTILLFEGWSVVTHTQPGTDEKGLKS